MATKSMAYDNPAYQSVYPITDSLAGNAATVQWAAFTNMIVKSITVKPTTAGTSADALTMLYRGASGTGTTTTILGTYGSGALTGTNFLTTLTMSQGDGLQVLKGADATVTYGVTFETLIVPGANVTL